MTEADFLVVGAGMGGLAAGAAAAADGRKVTLLEAAHVVGGCSSSYRRKGHVFESGATTLIGFDAHQPLARLERLLDIAIPRQPLQPSMTVRLNGRTVIRHQDRQAWIGEVSEQFGHATGQRRFWELAYRVSDAVWRLSERNHFFPPVRPADYLQLVRNDPRDLPTLRFAFRSVADVMADHGLTSPEFRAFVDEQLLISAQAGAADTPFLFGAPALTYPNSTNYYVPGGLLRMAETVRDAITVRGGQVSVKHLVDSVRQKGTRWHVRCTNGTEFMARQVVLNIPIWNVPEITEPRVARWMRTQADRYERAWGAFTMGIVTDDPYPTDLTLHQQIHPDTPLPVTRSTSVFVSFSMRGDTLRTPDGTRVLAVSTHTPTEPWFDLDPAEYDRRKAEVAASVLDTLRKSLPGFDRARILHMFPATPSTWENWVYRYKGRVGGIPQTMGRALWDWTPSETPFPGLFLCGDTVYPGQGIPGVTLGGLHVYLRAKRQL